MRIRIDLGDDGDQAHLEAHLAQRGLGISDVLAVAEAAVARRKGRRVYAYGRGDGSQLVVVVLRITGIGLRPMTAWEMDDVERRWWRRHGGR